MTITSLRLAQALECSMCGQLYNDALRIEIEKRIELFGSRGYAVCPRCQQEVSEEVMNDKIYRKKADRFIQNKIDHLNLTKRRGRK